MKMTPKAKEMYAAIVDFEDEHGISPISTEIQKYLEWSSRDTTLRCAHLLLEHGLIRHVSFSPKHTRYVSVRSPDEKIQQLKSELKKLGVSA